MANAPSPNDLTRQQLDELDALLQRMLSLPLASGEAPVGAALASPRPTVQELPVPDPPRPVPAPRSVAPSPPPYTHPLLPSTLQALNTSRETTPTVWRGDPVSPSIGPQLLTMPAPSEPTPAPLPLTRKTPAPMRPVEPPPAPTVPAPTPAIPEVSASLRFAMPDAVLAQSHAHAAVVSPSEATAPAPVRGEPIPAALQPFVALNRAVNFVGGHLGVPGRLLRSGFGKNLLGTAGIALFVYATARIVQVQGWFALPFDLPWPG